MVPVSESETPTSPEMTDISGLTQLLHICGNTLYPAKLRYFVGCFVGVVMYGAFDGKVKLAENKSTRLPTDLFTQGIFVFHNVAY